MIDRNSAVTSISLRCGLLLIQILLKAREDLADLIGLAKVGHRVNAAIRT
jgi:hypothetical protein